MARSSWHRFERENCSDARKKTAISDLGDSARYGHFGQGRIFATGRERFGKEETRLVPAEEGRGRNACSAVSSYPGSIASLIVNYHSNVSSASVPVSCERY